MDWKPIESAPKDGTAVLISDGICLPDVATWEKARPERVDSGGTRWLARPEGWFNIQRSRILTPTIWMHIPALPEPPA